MENTVKIVTMTLDELIRFIDDRDKKNASKIEVTNKPDNQDLLTTDQACELLHVSKATLINWYKRGWLEKRKRIGRRVFYSKKEILSRLNDKNY